MEAIDIRLIIVQVIGFLILFFILKKYLFGRIIDLIKARENEIRGIYNGAEQDKNQASKLKSQYETRISEVEAEAHKKMQEAVLEAKEISENIINNTREQAGKIKEKANQEIEQEKKNALAEIRKEVVNLSIIATEKLIKESIDRNLAEKLVDGAIKDIREIS